MYTDEYGEEVLSNHEYSALQERYASSSVGTRIVPAYGWDSEAEREFAATIGKYLGDGVEFSPGRNVRTQIGSFRPDMILSLDGRVVGLEVDGKDFHKDEDADRLRDAALLAGRFVHVIYRFAASSTWFRPEDCLFVLTHYEPKLFDLKAREILIPRLSSNMVRSIEEYPSGGVEIFGEAPDESDFDGAEEPDLEPMFFRVNRRTLTTSAIQRTNAWVSKVLDRDGPVPFETLKIRYKQAIEKSRVAS